LFIWKVDNCEVDNTVLLFIWKVDNCEVDNTLLLLKWKVDNCEVDIHFTKQCENWMMNNVTI
jgi:hypothetical protein